MTVRAALPPLLGLLLLTLTPAAHGQGLPGGAGGIEPPPAPGQSPDSPPSTPGERRPEGWLALEPRVPEPPLLRAHAALVGWIECRTEVRADRGGLAGSNLDDLEGDQGLDRGGVAPWVELSLGRSVRGGVDLTWFGRGGQLTRQEQPVVFNGRVVAEAGGYVAASFELLNFGAFAEWDFLYDATYRIGLTGGVRYFRFDLSLTSLPNASVTALEHESTRGELISPYFGGLVELTPFPYLSVLARIEFMNWSWADAGLREARYFSLRLGAAVHPVPERLSVGVELRYSRIRAQGRDDDGNVGGSRVDGSLGALGGALVINLSF